MNYSVGKYVDDQAHTNGIESFWSLLKCGYHGTYHKMSRKHLDLYVNEFSGRHNAVPRTPWTRWQGLPVASQDDGLCTGT